MYLCNAKRPTAQGTPILYMGHGNLVLLRSTALSYGLWAPEEQRSRTGLIAEAFNNGRTNWVWYLKNIHSGLIGQKSKGSLYHLWRLVGEDKYHDVMCDCNSQRPSGGD